MGCKSSKNAHSKLKNNREDIKRNNTDFTGKDYFINIII